MKDLRMPKGWIHVMTNATEFGPEEGKREKVKRFHDFEKMIKNTKKKSLAELITEGLEAAQQAAAESNLKKSKVRVEKKNSK